MGRRATITFGILLACCPCAFPLNPSLDINQYAHTAWTIRDGFFKGAISSIAQTPDGYLWLGTESGLLRFDGVRAVPWQLPASERLPSSFIRRLLAARDGRLWIGTEEGLASWKDGKLTRYREFAGQVRPLLEDRQGTVWVAEGNGVAAARLCSMQSGGTHCYGEDGSFGRQVTALYEDSRGNLWAGAFTGLFRLKPAPPKFYPMPDLVEALIEGDDGKLLIDVRSGIKQLVQGKSEVFPLPGAGRELRPLRMLRDRDGNLWIGTVGQGLLRVYQGRTDQFTQSDGLSSNNVLALSEDREGNIWVVTTNGLDRFRDFLFPAMSVKQGLSSTVLGPVQADMGGGVWIGSPTGLNRWNGKQVTIYRKGSSGLPDDAAQCLFQDHRGRIWIATPHGVAYFEKGRFIPVSSVPGGQIHAIAGDSAGNLWISHQDHGLFHLRDGRLVEQIPWARLGRKDFAYALLADPVQGGLWLGYFKGGVAYFKDGEVRTSYAGPDGLGEDRVNGLLLDRGDTLWAATEGGLSRVQNGRIATLTSKNGLPCDSVAGALEDDDHSFWLYMACGVVRVGQPALDAWVTDPKRTVPVTVFDSSDGVRSHPLTNIFSPQLAKSVDGNLWLFSFDGVTVIDPRHLAFNPLPPPVHIEQITADRKTYDTSSNLRLPPLIRDLQIDYAALSLVVPEKNRFRVKLEGYDPDWKDTGNDRKASYNNLPPRNYRFRVIASNNSGVWNELGASFDFSIRPAYYQTAWFQASCAAAFLGLLWALYRYRLHQIAREFNARLDERVNERTRIARDLHDTLLQSFQGLMLRFQVAYDEIVDRPAEARKMLGNALDLAAQAITEGRDAVQGLRSSTIETNDLARAIGSLGEELAGDETGSNRVESFVEVEGAPRHVPPILRDEIYRIAGEALRNAFRHAQARRIKVAITYGEREFRLHVRDDGKGIGAEVLDKQGRAGHWGLPGMHERAELIGGHLEIWSRQESGTEVELSIPASIAYTTSPPGRFRWFAKKGSINNSIF